MVRPISAAVSCVFSLFQTVIVLVLHINVMVFLGGLKKNFHTQKLQKRKLKREVGLYAVEKGVPAGMAAY